MQGMIDNKCLLKFNVLDFENKVFNINNRVHYLDIEINGKLNKVKKIIKKEIFESKFVYSNTIDKL